MDFQVWDFPGHLDYFDPVFDHSALFSEIGALIWVIDAQDEYIDAIGRLNQTILHLHATYPAINIEVFVHKVDGLSEEYRQDVYQDVVMRVTDELSDANVENAPVQFYQTSIYDHSIFEAFSKVIQKLIPQLPTLEALLNSLCRNCRIEKAYLFDVLSKIYIATDTTPAGAGDYEVCSDYIDVVVDISEIYGWRINREQPVDAEGNPVESDSDDMDDEDDEDEGEGIEDAESLITMEKRKGNYLYLRELNRWVLFVADANPVLRTD
jgi:Ras-related GTP-binding protein C/D